MAINSARRKFIATLCCTAFVWPFTARAQQPAKLPIIGFLGATTQSAQSQWTAAFVQRLSELGWIEGRTIAIEYRWAEGRSERYAEILAEFVRLKVSVIVAHATAPIIAAKQATSAIPIVFADAADPVGTGLVASLARPGGNVTGLSLQQADVAAKRLELLRELVPTMRLLAGIIANVGFARRPARDAARLSKRPVDVMGLEVNALRNSATRRHRACHRATARAVCGRTLCLHRPAHIQQPRSHK